MFPSEKRPRIEQALSPDMETEDEQLDPFTSLSCPGEAAKTLELGEIQDQGLNIFTDDVCNKESSATDADVTSIAVEDVYESTAEDRPESTKTDILESEAGNLRTDLSHLTSAVEYMKAEIIELQKSKLPNSVEVTEPHGSNVQPREATASACDQYDDDSVLLKCKDIDDMLTYFPEMELIKEDLTIIWGVCIPKNKMRLVCPTGSALPAGMFSVRKSMLPRYPCALNIIHYIYKYNTKYKVFSTLPISPLDCVILDHQHGGRVVNAQEKFYFITQVRNYV